MPRHLCIGNRTGCPREIRNAFHLRLRIVTKHISLTERIVYDFTTATSIQDSCCFEGGESDDSIKNS